jgi:CTD small phosphatase-like protein 2
MAIFTAAEQTYADLIVDRLDPDRKIFSHRLYRQHCFKIDDVYVKDLRIINDRALEDMLIVDNSIISFAFQLDNGIPICAFFASNTQD